jgi:hypothetical protein
MAAVSGREKNGDDGENGPQDREDLEGTKGKEKSRGGRIVSNRTATV